MPCDTNRPNTTALRLSASSELDISTAAELLRSGRVVAFPTETVYGLGADATNPGAVSAIFAAKRRPNDNPLIVHISCQDDLFQQVLTPLPLSPLAASLADAFWPGPLTLVLPLDPNSNLAPAVTASLSSVAIRVPQHPTAAALLARAQVPIAAPSANLSGRPSPTTADHVLRDLANVIDAVVDTGQNADLNPSARCGLESTVVDLTSQTPTVLRPGAISISQLENVTGVSFQRVCHSHSDNSTPKAPGMKYRHYAPTAPLYIVQSSLPSAISEWSKSVKRIGILADLMICRSLQANGHVICVPCGDDGTAAGFARSLYGALRSFDGEGGESAISPPVDVILAVPPRQLDDGIGEAIMNRLRKAAAGHGDRLKGE